MISNNCKPNFKAFKVLKIISDKQKIMIMPITDQKETLRITF